MSTPKGGLKSGTGVPRSGFLNEDDKSHDNRFGKALAVEQAARDTERLVDDGVQPLLDNRLLLLGAQ